MLEDQQEGRTLGVKRAGIIAWAIALAACQPGTLPCDKNAEWSAICKGDDGGAGSGGSSTGGGGGSGGSNGSGGSGSGGMNGSGGTGGGGGGVTAATALANCAKYKTVGGMDEFFAMRCGAKGGTCHVDSTAIAWSDLNMADVWMRLKDVPAKSSCKGDSMIDSKAWDKSAIWRKTRPTVMCVGNGTAGSTMPPPALTPKMDPLTADEDACLQDYLKKLAGM